MDGFAGPAAVTAGTIASASSQSTSPLSAKQFSAVLIGEHEVSPVDTEATGRIKLSANSQQNALDYQISLQFKWYSHWSSYTLEQCGKKWTHSSKPEHR